MEVVVTPAAAVALTADVLAATNRGVIMILVVTFMLTIGIILVLVVRIRATFFPCVLAWVMHPAVLLVRSIILWLVVVIVTGRDCHGGHCGDVSCHRGGIPC